MKIKIIPISFLLLFSFFRFSAAESNLVASAGLNQIVNEETVVTLDASASTSADGTLKFTWIQVGGTEVVLKDSSHNKATFKAPKLTTNVPVPLIFELTVEDGSEHTAMDNVRVMVLNVNHAPLAEVASPGYVDEETPVILDATGSSDGDNDPLDFLWRQKDGQSVVLSHPRNQVVAFISPPASPNRSIRSMGFELTVIDDQGLSSTCTVRVHVSDRFVSKAEEMEAQQPLSLNSREKLHESQKKWELEDWAEKEMKQAKEVFEKNNFGEAQKYCERALMLVPSHEKAFKMIQDIRRKKWEPLQAELKMAREKFVQRDYLGSIRHSNNVKESDPFNREATGFSSVCLEALQQESNVRPVRPSKTEKNTELSRRFYNEGLVLYSQGQVRQAWLVWKKSLSMDRDNKMAVNAVNRAATELTEN